MADFTVICTSNQTKGKGQLGSEWQANEGENLTFSVFLNTSFLPSQNQFYLNCAVSISVFNVLKKIAVSKPSIKWPNDILSENKKLCGVLIENVLRSNTESHAIIGIGLNVNQKLFNPAYKASSLKNCTGIHYNLDEMLLMVMVELEYQVGLLKAKKYALLHKAYESELFRKNKPSTFKNAEGELFLGFIKHVTSSGMLQILLEDEITKEFRLKEVKLLY